MAALRRLPTFWVADLYSPRQSTSFSLSILTKTAPQMETSPCCGTLAQAGSRGRCRRRRLEVTGPRVDLAPGP